MIISVIMLLCFSCTKTKNSIPVVVKKTKSTSLDTTFTTTPSTASIIGKWYVNKERVQVLTASTGAITDTTYSGTTFDANSYYQFNSDSTATFTQGTIFFTSSFNTNGAITRMIFLYHVAGSQLTLGYKYAFPEPLNVNGGPFPLTITQLDATTLALHGTNSTLDGSMKTVLDAYLIRGQ